MYFLSDFAMKYKVILPDETGIKEFFKYAPSERVINAIQNKLDEIKSGNYKLTPKTFGKKSVFTTNVNIEGAHRIIFEEVIVENNSMLILRSIAYNHNYNQALTFKPFITLTREYISELGFFICNNECEVQENADFLINNYNNWIELTNAQTAIKSQILSKKSFPQSLTGPPGTGKSLIAEGLFQEQALQHQNDGKGVLKLAFISENENLIARKQSSWINFARNELDPNLPKVITAFLAPSQLITFASGKNKISDEELISIISRSLSKYLGTNKDSKNIKFTVLQLLEEFKLSSYILNFDIQNNKEYKDSHYKNNIGINQTILGQSDTDKSAIYKIYCDVIDTLNKEKKYHPDLISIDNISEEFKYDLIVFDEIQNVEIQTILNTMKFAKNNAIVFCGDTYQKCNKKISSLTLLETALFLTSKLRLTTDSLVDTHRMQKDTSQFCESLIRLDKALRKGVPDKTVYSSIESKSNENDKTHLFLVENLDSELKKIGMNANNSLIYLGENNSDFKNIIASNNIYSVSEAQGLEFEGIFVYISKEIQSKYFTEISRLMNEFYESGNLELPSYNNSPAKKGVVLDLYPEIISNLIVAISRSSGNVWIHFEEVDSNLEHKIKNFKSWLINLVDKKNEVKSRNNNINEITYDVIESSKEDWLERINLLIKNKLNNQAIAILIDKFSLNEMQSNKYIELYKARWNKLTTKEILDKINNELSINIENNPSPIIAFVYQDQKNKNVNLASPAAYAGPENLSDKKEKNRDVVQPQVQALAIAQDLETIDNTQLSDKVKEWVEELFLKIDLVQNVRIFLDHKDFKTILFQHKMKNGLTLLSNLIISGKYEHFIFNLNLNLLRPDRSSDEISNKRKVTINTILRDDKIIIEPKYKSENILVEIKNTNNNPKKLRDLISNDTNYELILALIENKSASTFISENFFGLIYVLALYDVSGSKKLK